ncbi:MAG: pyridoxamine 5'-phosphate oxidase family protein [Candidatus Gastranaerophilales bacterium]|nr:pyridoxamine 5'-phosphate oxidase family protein [Candidatus Gastranaerophilales bacterium]
MRRSDREVREFDEMVAIIEKCDVCRIALNDDGYPYILPLNFGMKVTEEKKLELYFHGAMEGTKYSLIDADNRASFEVDCGHELAMDEEKGNCAMVYESVIGQGYIEMVKEDDKEEALTVLMKHYHQEDFVYNKAVVPRTKVFKLVVEHMSGKHRRR